MPILRRLCGLIGFVVVVWASTGPTVAQNYPNRPIRIVVPFAAGGAVDTVGRIVAAKMWTSRTAGHRRKSHRRGWQYRR